VALGYQRLAQALVAEGTDVVFGVSGDGNMHLLTELVTSHGVQYVAARHENAAVAMADGYSRVTGRPGVCTVTHGPGLTHAATSLTVARHARSPVVLIAGATARDYRLHVQRFPQEPFALATAGAFRTVRLPATLAEDTQLAFRHVRLGGGPVVLEVGVDVQHGPLDPFTYLPSSRTLPAGQRRLADPAVLDEALAVLVRSERPIVLAGRGAVRSDALDAVARLADALGALLATALGARGAFAGHPFAIGTAGGLGSGLARELLAEADCVLAFGASLNAYTTGRGRAFPRAAVVQVNEDPAATGDPTDAAVTVLADARAAAEALLARLDGHTSSAWRTPELAARIAAHDPWDEDDLVPDGEGVDPRVVVRACNELLAEEVLAVIGIGHFGGWPAKHLQTRPGRLLAPWEFGAIGQAVPVGLGAAVADPGALVVVFEGDGSIFQSLGELETASRLGVRLLVVLLDDGAYGAELHKLARDGHPVDLVCFDNPDLGRVAASLGCEVIRAGTTAEVREAVARSAGLERPTVLHVPITRKAVQRVF
jgi:acetolactate synthase I/II/III large subunit